MAPAPAPTPSEWSPTPAAPPLEKIEKKKGFLGLFKRESSGTATAVIDQGTGTRPGLLAALANGLLAEYNSGQYGKGRVDERMPSLLMRVDEQADPIDRPLPIVADRIDVQALDRVALPDEQAAPYLATLVATIYGDAEKTFGRDKAKRGYKLVVHQVFGADLSAVSQSDVAGKLPRI